MVNNSENIEIGPGFTVEAWVKPTENNFWSDIVSKFNPRLGMTLAMGSIPSGDYTRLQFDFFANRKDCTGTAAYKELVVPVSQVQQWHHIAGVIQENGDTEIYADGKRLLNNPYSDVDGTCPTTGPVSIGAIYPNPAPDIFNDFSGLIDEVRISSVARYDGDTYQLPAPFKSDSDTVLLYHFNTKKSIKDNSKNDFDGKIYGDIKFVNSTVVIPTPTPSQSYTLEFSPPSVSMNVSPPNTGFGVAALLRKDGQLVTLQENIEYQWSIDDGSIAQITPYTGEYFDGNQQVCTFNMQLPCPYNYIMIKALKLGTTQIQVSVSDKSTGDTIQNGSFPLLVY